MIIIMLGAPGTGKGTVADAINEKLKIPQVSTGAIFRKHMKKRTKLGKLAESYIANGKLVPDEITIDVIKQEFEEIDISKGCILDGFPRTVNQAMALDKMLSEENREVGMVVNLTTPEDEIIQRIVDRRICSNEECRTIFNIQLNPPKQKGICDKCGHKLVQRKDDNVETVKLRLKEYFKETAPLIEYYEKKGKLYSAIVSKSVNKLGKDVADDVVKIIQKK